MKRYILLLPAFLVFTISYSQILPVLNHKTLNDVISNSNNTEKGDYYKDTQNYLDQFTGTWKYEEGGTIFILKIRRVNQFLFQAPNADFYSFSDVLIVNYKLITNGTILIDDLEKPTINSLTNISGYGLYTDIYPDSGIMGSFKDLTNNVIAPSYIKRMLTAPGETPKIHFLAIANSGTHRGNPKEFYESMSTIFSVPNDIILTKIE